MNANAKEVLRVQKKQFTMGLEWISVIESPLTSTEDRKIAIEQLAILNNSILELQAVVAQNELVCFS
jgi:hypothetical protein